MVVCPTDHSLQADIIFAIEATAVNGAYINDLKTNYIVPALEYFSQSNLDDNNYLSENANALYGIVVYHAADCLPHPSTDTIGPFAVPSKVLNALDKLEFVGGKGESHANVGEGLATSLQCFEELQQRRETAGNVQKHCILVCNSPPYLMPVMESQSYAGKTAEQLAAVLLEKGVNLSIVSPRKIPSLYKIFEKAGGDLTASQTKNYAKDPRHLVLLKGFSLKERPISPPAGSLNPNQPQTLPIPSLPSPLPNNTDTPLTVSSQSNQNLLVSNSQTGVVPSGVNQNPVYRPSSAQGLNQLPHSQSMVNTGMVAGRSGMMNNPQMPMQQLPAPPGYIASGSMGNRPPQRWSMMPPQPQQRAQYMQQQNVATQGSALIAQLQQPPSSISGSGVNQFGQLGNNSAMNPQQLRLNMQQNVKTSMPQNATGLQQTSNPSQITPQNQVVTSQAQAPHQQAQQTRERRTIWQGLLEWFDKPKNAPSEQKIIKHVPCQVSANLKDGEPELKADTWPSKLIMQLMPKHLIGTIGGEYLKDSKSVLFHPQSCEALESLTKVMSSGFAGCVHFTTIANTPSCDIKVLILLYTSEKRAYLGFIPNDQTAFVDRLRQVIQQQKSSQIRLRQNQGNAGGPSMNPQTGGGTPPQNTPTSQTTTQQGLMMSQTNTMAMGGGQITQNVVSSSGQPGSGMGGVLGANLPGGGMQPRVRMQMGPQQTQTGQGQQQQQQNMMGQRAPFENQLQVERQQNLEKINQLKQTLEAAQQQEQQYKSQLEQISQLKTSQLQEALQIAQQQEIQYQRLASQGNLQAGNAQQQQQQQRMMRPVMANNPGLRHLLQQQPQYRQQVMGMQQMGGNGPRPQMGQQMQGGGNSGQGTFDDVGNFDYM